MDNLLLSSVSPLDGRYRKTVLPLAEHISEEALIYKRIKLEILYLQALSGVGVVRKLTPEENKLLVKIYSEKDGRKTDSVKTFEEKTNHDVKAIELYLRSELENSSLKDMLEKLHYCLTSEDINNLAYRLIFKDALDNIFLPKVVELLNKLLDFASSTKDLPMMARTHGQDAVPTTLGKELGVFAVRLAKAYKQIKSVKLTGKLNGAIGGWNAHVFAEPQVDWRKFSKNFVENLDLEYSGFTTQINQFDDIVTVLGHLHLFNSILLGLDQDLWRYISDGWIKQKADAGQVGSSTMAQKINPIFFENSEGNINLVNGLIEALMRSLPLSRLQRDLSNSTTIRNLSTILGYEQLIVSSTITGLGKISPDTEAIAFYLNNNWAVLAEPLQILLRKHNIHDSYNIVKNLTIGQKTDKNEWKKLVSKLNLSPSIQKEAGKISLENYTGLCREIAEDAIKEIRSFLN